MAMNKIWMLDLPAFFTPPPKHGKYARLFKGGSAPAAPDPIATANAQAEANIKSARETAQLNRNDTVNPFSSTAWTNVGDKWTSTTTLDPKVQGIMDQIYANASTPAHSVDPSKFSSVGTGSDYRNAEAGNAAAGIWQNTAAMAANSQMMQQNQANAGTLNATANGMNGAIGQSANVAGQYGNIAGSQADRLAKLYATDFNYNSAPAMPQADEAARKSIEDAYYKQQTSRLDPQYKQYEDEMRSRLANQGITEGSEAYNKELQQFMRGRNDAYSSATNTSILNSTDQMQKLFNMGMAARQQGVTEANNLRQLPTAEAQAAMGMFGGASDIANSNRSTQGSLFGQIGNLNQQTSQLGLNNANLSASNSQLRDAAQNRAAQAQAMDQSGRTNQLNEASQLHNLDMSDRNNLINGLMALYSGSQVQAPGSSQVQVAAAPVAQSIYNSYNGQLQAYNTAQQANSAMWNTAGRLAGAWMGS